MVDADLAADRAVHLRQQRRRHLHDRDAAQVGGRGEPGDVADHAAAEGDDRGRRDRRSRGSARRRSAPTVASCLCRSPSGIRIGSSSAALLEIVAVKSPDRLARHDEPARAARGGIERGAQARGEPGGDLDGVAAARRADRAVAPVPSRLSGTHRRVGDGRIAASERLGASLGLSHRRQRHRRAARRRRSSPVPATSSS